MPYNSRVPSLHSIALLLAVVGCFQRVAEAQINGPGAKGNAGPDLCSQVPPEAHGASFLDCLEISRFGERHWGNVNPERNLNLDSPRFDRNNGGGFEGSFFQLVNLDERVGQTDDSSAQVLTPLPIASAPSQVPSELLVESDSPGTPDTAPPLP